MFHVKHPPPSSCSRLRRMAPGTEVFHVKQEKGPRDSPTERNSARMGIRSAWADRMILEHCSSHFPVSTFREIYSVVRYMVLPQHGFPGRHGPSGNQGSEWTQEGNSALLSRLRLATERNRAGSEPLERGRIHEGTTEANCRRTLPSSLRSIQPERHPA